MSLLMADQHSIGQYYTTKRSIRQLKWNERHHFAIEDVIIIIRESKMMTTMTKMKQQLKRSTNLLPEKRLDS
ncbi:hypothetical protein RDWZM_002649 [Blomia tropicalis]|uniref:Uncharacterized protein n=1 Tax=Blomia tropicalis TaxID=40697 RepID=A0A9Q0MEK7_BLOTA|nr:hypothetical protein RDWZM_002649 [Blomia tropicalis]